MEAVEPDDGEPFRRPPDLDDRIWRHPSEVGGRAGGSRRAETHPYVPRSLWSVALVSALGASLLTAGLLVAVGGLTTRHEQVRPVATDVATPPSTAVGGVDGIAARVRPAIAQVRAERPDGEVSGSGVIFRSDGEVLTNAHVVDGAIAVDIVLASGRRLSGKVVGSDALTDAAVVKVDGGPFPAAELGSAADLRVGQTAVAMGFPVALAGGPSVNVGVISALHRSVRTPANVSLFDMIQTDAPIASGASGGALLDAAGRVIGITTAIPVSDVGPEGLGLATPIDTARSVADQLIATGRATHAWLGIEGTDLDGATALDLDLDGGAIVNAVKPATPAEAAGLAARDVIVSIDGQPVLSMGALVAALRNHRPGETVTIEVVRDDKARSTHTLTLAERPATP
jgi:S1-C subfamily serine protease